MLYIPVKCVKIRFRIFCIFNDTLKAMEAGFFCEKFEYLFINELLDF